MAAIDYIFIINWQCFNREREKKAQEEVLLPKMLPEGVKPCSDAQMCYCVCF